jgi:C4-dicarboxylate-specific signal transduction histidine kinase
MVFRDVTEDQRVQTQRALAARVASRETLVAGVTQQLSYPVAAVLACAARAREALGRRHGPGDGRPEDVAEALAALSELEAAASQVARILEEFQGSARAAGDAT